MGGDYNFDLEKEVLYYKTTPLQLGKKERKLLTLLVASRGTIVPFSTLELLLWKEGPPQESSLRMVVYRLRGKLKHDFIKTVKSIGLSITAEN